MIKISILLTLLLHLLCIKTTILAEVCSEYLTYISNGTTDKVELLGRIEIPSVSENDDFFLRVAFNADEFVKQLIELHLARTIKESVRAVQKGNSLLYNIYFTKVSGESIPRVTAIWFNNRQYCPGPTKTLTGNLGIGHIVFASKEPLSWRRNSSRIINEDDPIGSYHNYLALSTANFSFSNTNECGITNYYTDETNNLMANGEKALPGQWPWIAAIFVVTTSYNFLCVGTVLTTRHVITAAHCMKTSGNDTVDPDNLFVTFGKLNLRQWNENGITIREVESYKIHPDFAHTISADSDLAILILRMPVDFSPFIKPICLWFGPTNLENVVDRTGYVVGWGQRIFENNDFSRHVSRYTRESEIPRMSRVSIVNKEECAQADTRFNQLISERTFCAGFRNEIDLCNVDSGSGLMLFDSITGRYELRGIVSRTIVGNLKSSCTLRYVVYVDVAKYMPWIRQQISTT
ncbi:serine protease gd isoform X2 [Solenopsis invicta]|nr:serine protease gd isoform X2 [Solenopsis invicta]XP_039311857.1 serine protease gd isoform X2 [Solenopsis invicta]